MAGEMGLISGLMGGQMSGDSTTIPLQIRAIMAKRKAASTDTTPKISVEDDIKAANAGKRVPPVPDSTIKMAHDQWLKHIDALGYEVKPKSNTPK